MNWPTGAHAQSGTVETFELSPTRELILDMIEFGRMCRPMSNNPSAAAAIEVGSLLYIFWEDGALTILGGSVAHALRYDYCWER